VNSRFSLSRIQKIGIASFAVVILSLVVLLNVNNGNHLPDASETALASFVFSPLAEDDNSETNTVEEGSRQISYFKPNKLNLAGWEELGFTKKQASAIVKYRSAYGPFKSADDVGKIYVISEDKFQEIKPFMVFDKTENDFLDTISFFKPILVNINSASKEALQEISGIGPAFSDRIVKYRNILGGFYSKDQYAEVYGLIDESLAALESHTLIDLGSIEKIKINSISKPEMKKHPYFKKWEVVSAILSKRDKERLSSLYFLVEDEVVALEELEKMEAYVSYQ
jgi:competence protein ComEA